MRWFYKTTEKIPVKNALKRDFGDTTYWALYVQGGIDSIAGNVYINYNFISMYNPFFWEMHFHEFLHRLFWILKWENMDRVIEFLNLTLFKHLIIKRKRLEKS